MKNLLKFIIIFFSITNFSYSADKIAFVDIDFIINSSEIGKKLNKNLKLPVTVVTDHDTHRNFPQFGGITYKLVKQNNVDFVAGFIWSHVLLASQKSALDAGKFLISSNAGPSQIAGKLCHKNFFSTLIFP